jgi:putative ABC transport system permease protein
LQKIPLAWLQLTKQKGRFAAALAGITFAVVLMLMQLGLRAVLYDAATRIPDHLLGDLVIMSAHHEFVYFTRPFSRYELYRALALDGVQSVAPLYLGMVTWREPIHLSQHEIFLIGISPSHPALDLPGLAEHLRDLHLPDTVLFDTDSRPEYGPVEELYKSNSHLVTEINGQRVKIAGLVRMGATFGAGGHIVTSDVNSSRVFSRPLDLIDLGLVRLKPGADPYDVAAQLVGRLPPSLKVMTREQFAAHERDYWEGRVAIGFIFDLGSVLGLVVGLIIVYQILFTDVTEHLKEYAALKAIGYLDRQLYGVVIKEALILSVLGFLPGYLIANGMYVLARSQAYVPMHMTAGRVIFVFCVTAAMCCGAAGLAMRKLERADPADIF